MQQEFEDQKLHPFKIAWMGLIKFWCLISTASTVIEYLDVTILLESLHLTALLEYLIT